MLVAIGKQGHIAKASPQAQTSGFVLERINVLNRTGTTFTVPLGAYNASGKFVATMRWAETATNGHVLLTPNYTPGSMTVYSANGVPYTINEPVEVVNAGGMDFYIVKVALSKDAVQYQIIQ